MGETMPVLSMAVLAAVAYADAGESAPPAVLDAVGLTTDASEDEFPAIGCDGSGRPWIAWDDGGRDWGQHGEALRRLHSQRSVHVRCLDGRRLLEPASELTEVLTGELARFSELPELLIDASGRLWLFLRHLEDLTPKGRRKDGRPYQSRGIWNPYALVYAGDRWSAPVELPASNGRNDMRLAVCRDREGAIRVAWAEDGRRPARSEEPVNHNVHAARLEWDAERTARLSTRASGTTATIFPAMAKTDAGGPRHTITAGGKTYRLVFGDTHRHTDISRCGMNHDGSLRDTYRYAIDAAGLDFLAISDHDQDILRHRYDRKKSPLLGYAWWRSQKYCDIFLIDGRFLPIYAYEHGGSFARRGGHKNVLYQERGMPCHEMDAPEALAQALRGIEAVVIPHQLADGGSATDWTRWSDKWERVAEIFQARGTYEFFGAPPGVRVSREGLFLWDALGSGVKIGVIASSDHGLVHGAYAGVYVREFSRRGILEALRARRSFGSTDTIVLGLSAGERLLGEEIRVDGPPAFEVFARGTAPLKQVQIVRDGRFIYTKDPAGERSARFRYTDTDLEPGSESYYYVRCEQANGEWAWSSAIWVLRESAR